MRQFCNSKNGRSGLDDKVAVNTAVDHSVWIVPALFCVTCYINDARYLPKDGFAQNRSVRKPNVDLEQNFMIDTARDMTFHTILTVKLTRNINNEEKTFLHYGIDYNIQKQTIEFPL